jgi:hypothetical protein
VTGKVYAADYAPPTPTIMTTAVGDMQTAYTDAAGRTTPAPIVNLGAGNIGGLTLAPGLYKWSTGVVIPTSVTLSGGVNDVWIFQIAKDLTVSSGVTVVLSGGAQAKNIFWQVAGEVTLGTTSAFQGIILCKTLIAMNTGATLNGRALAQTAVTLIANGIVSPGPVSAPSLMTVSYLIVGGGTPTAPVFYYVVGGVSKSLTLAKTAKAVSVDAGSPWSVTPNPLRGSSSSERWYSNQPLTGTASATTIVFVFYRQTLQTLSYSVSRGGSGYSPPTFQANQFGSPVSVTLTTTTTKYWFDYGSTWTAGPNPLAGSTSSERWFTTQTITGTIGSSRTLAFKYQHQFYLTMQLTPSGSGTVYPSSGWYNSGQRVTILEIAKTGHKFLGWTGAGTGSYAGASAYATITMNSAITETANFS